MQAVILAAGRGTRMKELTENSPKALLEVAGRPLLQYALDTLPNDVDEVVIIVGYLGGMIHDRFGPEYYGKRLLYVEQEELNGTAGALSLAKHDTSFPVNRSQTRTVPSAEADAPHMCDIATALIEAVCPVMQSFSVR